MRVPLHSLQGHLGKGLAPIYLLTGDEPLQLGEAADAVRAAARNQGYSEREILDVDPRFDWERLAAEASNLSLFAERRIIDLRIDSGKPGTSGSKALAGYAARPADDTLLLITLPRLDKKQLSSKWVKALDKAGVMVQVWQVEGTRLPPWIEQRMRAVGLTPAPQVTSMLAERVEGNLLAATQEIDKLLLLNGPGVVTPELLSSAVADSARYDVFGLVDSALAGQTARSIRILNGLQAEGTAAAVVLWALSRELRLLCSLAHSVAAGRSPQQAISGRREIWEKRRPLVSKGLQRLSADEWSRLLRLCSSVDLAIKGESTEDPWLLMQQIASRMTGVPATA